MPNIKFNYRYRDGANYKRFNSVIFANPTGIDLSTLEDIIRSKLIDETYFYADEWGLPEIFTETWHFRNDPSWHEFEGVEFTEDFYHGWSSDIEIMTFIAKTK